MFVVGLQNCAQTAGIAVVERLLRALVVLPADVTTIRGHFDLEHVFDRHLLLLVRCPGPGGETGLHAPNHRLIVGLRHRSDRIRILIGVVLVPAFAATRGQQTDRVQGLAKTCQQQQRTHCRPNDYTPTGHHWR